MSEIEKYYNGEIHVDFDEIPIKRKSWEELSQEIIELNDSITWWSNRFNAVERDNRKLKKENKRLHSIIKEVREKLNTQLAFTSSYQLNYQSAMSIIEEAKSILDKENKDGER